MDYEMSEVVEDLKIFVVVALLGMKKHKWV